MVRSALDAEMAGAGMVVPFDGTTNGAGNIGQGQFFTRRHEGTKKREKIQIEGVGEEEDVSLGSTKTERTTTQERGWRQEYWDCGGEMLVKYLV